MQSFSFHQEALDYYQRKGKRTFWIFLLFTIFYMIVIFNNGMKFPSLEDLFEGGHRLSDSEITCVILTVFWIFIFSCSLFEAFSIAGARAGIEMSEVELFEDHLCISYPVIQGAQKKPQKSFVHLSYDEVEKVKVEKYYEKGQKVNFTLYHKGGVVEVCIESPQRVEKIIETKKKREEYPLNKEETEKEGAFEENAGVKPSLLIGVCPLCQKEFEIPAGQKSFPCPWCSTIIEL